MSYNISPVYFDTFAMMFFDDLVAQNHSGWAKVPCIVPKDQNGLICDPAKAPYVARIIILENGTIIKMQGARSLIGKKVLPPTVNDLVSQSISIDRSFRLLKPFSQLGFLSTEELETFWRTGKPYSSPIKNYISVYKLFRDISVKSCPDLRTGEPSEEEPPSQCPSC